MNLTVFKSSCRLWGSLADALWDKQGLVWWETEMLLCYLCSSVSVPIWTIFDHVRCSCLWLREHYKTGVDVPCFQVCWFFSWCSLRSFTVGSTRLLRCYALQTGCSTRWEAGSVVYKASESRCHNEKKRRKLKVVLPNKTTVGFCFWVYGVKFVAVL